LEIFGDGRQTRDFIYAKDLAKILVGAIEKEAMYGQTINVGTGASVSLLDIIEKISIILNKKLEVKHCDARSGDIRHSLANVAKLRSLNSGEYSITSLLDGLSAAISK
jgi:UDP-glucose 4-epimerase